MIKATFTCNCYEPEFREDITVTAETFDEAWDLAKKKMARKHKAKLFNIRITASHCVNEEEEARNGTVTWKIVEVPQAKPKGERNE